MRGRCARCEARSPRKQAEQHRGRVRDKRVKALYDSQRWRSARLTMLREYPLCAGWPAGSHGDLLVPATDVDHVQPHKMHAAVTPEQDRAALALFWRRSNWQTLCHECHSVKTAREDGGFGRTPSRGVGGVKSLAKTSPRPHG